VSFEFFPPKSPEMEDRLWETIKELEPLNPHFVSVTYGAGGSTRERTHHTVKRILDETTLTPAAHLTCVNATKEEVNEVAQAYWDSGVKHIVALRGDTPPDAGLYTPKEDGYAYAVDLVKGLRDIGDFEISVAAYPEGHPEAVDLDTDIDHLKAKVDAGATRAITQYFFDAEMYLRFLDKAQKRGIDVPIIPGIVSINNFRQIIKFSKMCGTSIPPWVHHIMEPLEDNPQLHMIGAALIATEQCRILAEHGINEFHFYTLNNAALTKAVCSLLNIRAKA
jgi:methylenetetrahydrofolate reductase (NADPH)